MASGKLLNIGGDKDDRFYRYKMPPIISKIEGKGNGIKTVIPNMSDISKALLRPATYPTKFFGCELGAQVKCEEKSDRYIVNGAHDAGKLQQLLDGFIQRFVLCAACGNPETDLLISRDECIVRDCKACGQRTDVDMRHKLTTFILKNPPNGALEGKGRKKGKKGRKCDGKNGTSSPLESECHGEISAEESGEDELTREIQNAAKATPAPENINDDDWAEDMSKEAIKARQRDLVDGVKGMDLSDSEDNESDPYDVLASYITENNPSNAEILAKIDALNLKASNVVQLLSQVLFTTAILSAKQIPSRTDLLKKIATTTKLQRALLGGFERLVSLQFPELMSKIPQICMALYEEEIIEEEVFLEWAKKASKKYVGKKKLAEEILEKATPFLDWLRTADEEDSEEDSDE